ncbi:copper homeostasis protein CutC [Histidinibacterium lentulum]|uniref:PF03932 family protein CutC n=1 Tax=Histidinibacterium lentulum TaxID=2480588 RepID=A0A3N2R8A5_9RHOB|nr:copper homeostasis protein CutC [Histidinibacterium lentulum]ROU03611.1 copper homeostasis protein CutC [Histidinibacterium lentulum]
MIPLEVPVDTAAGLAAAHAGGAARIELCAALSEGGLTPSAGLMAEAARLPIPVHAMIRPRAGLFRFDAAEAEIMAADIRAARAAGLEGVVIGAQDASGGLDVPLLGRLAAEAGPLSLTLHRVIDVVPDPLAALDAAIALGFSRLLSSGGAATAWDGRERLAALVSRAAGRIIVMAGAGVGPDHARRLVAETGVTELHASCSGPAPAAAPLGLAPPGLRQTSEARVRALVAALGQETRSPDASR